jgi:hypothetical protein
MAYGRCKHLWIKSLFVFMLLGLLFLTGCLYDFGSGEQLREKPQYFQGYIIHNPDNQ